MSKKIATGEGMLQALSFSIQLSDRTRCNARCKFCISRTTPNCGPEDPNGVKLCDFNRLKVGLGFAKHIGATHAILTGKADPLQEKPEYIKEVIATSREYLPLVDMHTNGLLLNRRISLAELAEAGLTNITFSVASFDDYYNKSLMGIDEVPRQAIREAVKLGLFVRCSLVLNTVGVKDFAGIMEYIKAAGNLGVHAVVIREIWRPTKMLGQHQDVYDWNMNHYIDLEEPMARFQEMSKVKDNKYGLSERDPLPWGTPVFTMDGVFDDPDHGVNITFARCDEATTGNVIKSITHRPDGHGCRNWDSKGDILY